LHYSLSAAGFVTALSDRFPVGGPFPCQQLDCLILPGLRLLEAGEMPPLREGDRYVFGLCLKAQQLRSFS
jgi:hypothetical protein